MNVLPTIQPNNSAIAFLIVIICVGSVAIIVLVGRYFNIWQKTKRLTSFKFSPKKFRELADAAELSDDEQVLLENYFRSVKIPRFLEIFYDYRFSQNIMRLIYRATYIHMENFHCDDEQARFYVFSIMQKLENFLHKNVFANNTRKIPKGSRFYLNVSGGDNEYHNKKIRLVCKLHSNRRNYFEAQLLHGNYKNISNKSEVEIGIVKAGDRAIYTSKVQSYSRNHRNRKKLLILKHGKRLQIIFGARRYKRKEFQTSAAVVPLRKEDNTFRVNGETINALLCDISMTGCGILSHVKYPMNSFIGVSYLNPYDNKKIKFICEIMRHNKLRNNDIDLVILQNRIENIKYHDQNLISAFVYEFESENDKIKKLQESENSQVLNFDKSTVAVLHSRS